MQSNRIRGRIWRNLRARAFNSIASSATVGTARSILRETIRFDRGEVKVKWRIRYALGVGIPLLVGAATGDLVEGVAVSGGALMAGLTDSGAPYRGRLRCRLRARSPRRVGSRLAQRAQGLSRGLGHLQRGRARGGATPRRLGARRAAWCGRPGSVLAGEGAPPEDPVRHRRPRRSALGAPRGTDPARQPDFALQRLPPCDPPRRHDGGRGDDCPDLRTASWLLDSVDGSVRAASGLRLDVRPRAPAVRRRGPRGGARDADYCRAESWPVRPCRADHRALVGVLHVPAGQLWAVHALDHAMHHLLRGVRWTAYRVRHPLDPAARHHDRGNSDARYLRALADVGAEAAA